MPENDGLQKQKTKNVPVFCMRVCMT